MKHSITYLLIFSLIGLASCKKDRSGDTDPVNVNKIAPDGFTFKTAKDIAVDVTLRSNNNQPLKGVIVSLYKTDNTEADAAIFKGVTDANGNLKATISVDNYLDKIVIDPSYVGLIRYATAAINGGSTKVVIGGADGFSGDIIADAVHTTSAIRTNSLGTNGTLATEYVYPDPYTASNAFTTPTNLGKPKYLETTSDVIDPSLLSYVNASLPEGKPLTTTHPEYLTSTAATTINVKAKSDVWITFVSEGAGYQNALGFFTYKTATPPTLSSGGTLLGGIDKITYIFPNASALGSGGGLKSGDKVKLGTFEAGTSIGFVLFQDAWSGSNVSTSGTKFYSLDKFNPETTTSLKKHNVMLYDDVHKLFLLGFEDINRQTGGSDNDFNDLVVYATANPITALSTDNVAAIDNGGDTDGDGVIDELDAFPNDASKAYISYFPSASTYSQVAFEDNWPQKGDYDLNDLVVNYRYTFVSNAKNQVVTLNGDFIALAAGASFKNGFGVQLPVSASTVASVTGQKTTGNLVTFASNGVEAGQTKAVIIPFDNQDAVIKNADNSFFVNTQLNRVKVTGTTVSVFITFGSPVDQANLAASTFNPFLISNQRRGVEVHLPGYAPTDKADQKLFGTADDGSKTNGTYYTSTENWPWAIAFNTAVNYPIEEASITKAYLHFADWAASGGTQYIDWYSNTTSGYRNDSFIYLK